MNRQCCAQIVTHYNCQWACNGIDFEHLMYFNLWIIYERVISVKGKVSASVRLYTSPDVHAITAKLAPTKQFSIFVLHAAAEQAPAERVYHAFFSIIISINTSEVFFQAMFHHRQTITAPSNSIMSLVVAASSSTSPLVRFRVSQ